MKGICEAPKRIWLPMPMAIIGQSWKQGRRKLLTKWISYRRINKGETWHVSKIRKVRNSCCIWFDEYFVFPYMESKSVLNYLNLVRLMPHTVEITEIYSHRKKNSSNQLFSNFFYKTVTLKGFFFCQKSVRVNFHNFHSVYYFLRPSMLGYHLLKLLLAYYLMTSSTW